MVRPGIYDYNNIVSSRKTSETDEIEAVFDLISEFNDKGQLHGVALMVNAEGTAQIVPGIYESIDFVVDDNGNGRLTAYR